MIINGDGGGDDSYSSGRREGIRSYRSSYVVVSNSYVILSIIGN